MIYNEVSNSGGNSLNTQKSLLFGFLVAVFAAQSAIADSIIFTPIPSGPTLSSAGSIVGYGYTITNNTNLFYQPTSLSTDSFSFGTSNLIFDFPEVLPDSTVTLLFSQTLNNSCLAPDCGALEVTLAGDPGSVDSGVFTLSGEFYSDFNETIDAGVATDVTAPYSVGVAAPLTGAPEPSSLGLSLSLIHI